VICEYPFDFYLLRRKSSRGVENRKDVFSAIFLGDFFRQVGFVRLESESYFGSIFGIRKPFEARFFSPFDDLSAMDSFILRSCFHVGVVRWRRGG